MRAAAYDPLTAFTQQRQHRRRVDELLVTIENAFRLSESRGWDAAISLRLVPSLQELDDRLGMLFAIEESEGYFDEEIVAAPRLCERARALQAEHCELYGAACEIAEDADRILHHPMFIHLLERIEARFSAFAEKYRAHEIAERELLMQALDDDIGGED